MSNLKVARLEMSKTSTRKLKRLMLSLLGSLWFTGAIAAQGVIDSDLDGVPDGKDACPKTRANVAVDARGCEIQEADSQCLMAKGQLLTDCDKGAVSIYFAFASAEIAISQWSQLARVKTFLQHKNARLILVGHTDNIGSEAFNLALSRQRAERVKQILVEDYGFQAERFSIVAKGASEPISNNEGESGRALNRRVEFMVEAR